MTGAITFLELRTGAALSSIPVLNELLDVATRALGVDGATAHDLALGLAELVANVVEHELREDEDGVVTVRLEKSAAELALMVESQGPAFDLNAALERAAQRDPLAELDGSGLGLPMLAVLFDRIEHAYEDGQNRIALRRST